MKRGPHWSVSNRRPARSSAALKARFYVSVRSGAKFSMPGMMDTVLNLGLNDDTREALAYLTGNERFSYDAYRRFVQLFGKIVLGIESEKFDPEFDEHKKKLGVTEDTRVSRDAQPS